MLEIRSDRAKMGKNSQKRDRCVPKLNGVVFYFLAFIVSVFVVPNAIAIDYVFITRDANESTWEVDRENVRTEGRFIRFWQKLTYKTPVIQPNGRYVVNSLISSAVDCERQTDATTAWVEKDANERIIESSTSQSWDEKEVIPGSVGFSINEFACALVGKTFGPREDGNLAFFSSDQWEYVEKNSTGKIYTASEREPKNGLVRTVVRLDLWRPEVIGGRTVTRYVFRELYDCQKMMARGEQVWLYNLGGKEVHSFEQKDDFVRPVKTSPVEMAMKVACSESKGPASSAEVTSNSYSVGTGWISDSGYIVTANHVVDGRSKITIVLPNKTRMAVQIVAVDGVNDIAILDIPLADYKEKKLTGLSLARGTVNLGARVFTLGYPLKDILGASPKLTAGEISATSGIRDDPRIVQISVPVQAGNSGGPLLNMKGEVVGLISAKLSAVQVLKATGDLPQNVNYAIKGRYVEGLLMDLPQKNIPTVRIVPQSSLEEIVSKIRDMVFIVIAE